MRSQLIILRYRILNPVFGETFGLWAFTVEAPDDFRNRQGPEYEAAVEKIRKNVETKGHVFLGVAAIV